MKESFLTVGPGGELVFRAAGKKETDKKYMSEASKELAEKSAHCRRELEADVNSDTVVQIVSLSILIGLAAVLSVLGALWAVWIKWGYVVLSAFAFAGMICGLIFLLLGINVRGTRQETLSHGELYCGKLVAVDGYVFGSKTGYTFVVDGKEVTHVLDLSQKALKNLQSKPFLIIAYDRSTKKSVPVRLFAEG